VRDIVVIGGGHNGLVCGAYLAAAGLDVEVLEANDTAGGCIWTHPLETGHRLELGAIDLTMIEQVASDLHLADHGLQLLSRDILVGSAFGDGTRMLFHRDLGETLEGLRGVDSSDRDAYRSFAELAGRVLGAVVTLPGVPSFGDIIALAESLSTGVDLGRLLVSSAESVIGRRINDERLASSMAMYGSHAQLPSWLPGTGLFALLLAGSHGGSAFRAVGGTGALVAAIASAFRSSGGTLRTNARVESIAAVPGGASVLLHDGEAVATRQIVSSLDIRRTTRLLADAPATLRSAAAATQSGALNVGELKIDLALSAPATITGGAADAALWLLQERPDSLRTAFAEIVAGELPSNAAMMWAAPSALDPTAAPDGGGTVWISSFVPINIRNRPWDAAAEEEAADRVLDGFARITGIDVRPLTVDRSIIGPMGWQRRIGASGGNPNHLDLTIDQLFAWRPPGARAYRTEVPWLYVTGAGTFPGGGVSGLPGRNAARAVLADLGSAPSARHRLVEEANGLRDAFAVYRSMRKEA